MLICKVCNVLHLGFLSHIKQAVDLVLEIFLEILNMVVETPEV